MALFQSHDESYDENEWAVQKIVVLVLRNGFGRNGFCDDVRPKYGTAKPVTGLRILSSEPYVFHL